jgi:hypothetical protein
MLAANAAARVSVAGLHTRPPAAGRRPARAQPLEPRTRSAVGFGWSDAARLAGWLVTLSAGVMIALLIVSLAGWADRDRRR